MYELKFLPGAERYFKKVKEKGLKAAFRKALEAIQNDPYIMSTEQWPISPWVEK